MKSLGIQTKKQAEAADAKCIPLWEDDILKLTFAGVPPAKVEAWLKPFIESIRMRPATLSICQMDMQLSPDVCFPSDYFGPGAIIREKLTRKSLLTWPEGAYVVSNIYPNGRSAFAERLGDDESRADAWRQAVAAGAAGRLCELLWTEQAFQEAIAPISLQAKIAFLASGRPKGGLA